jgi:hypothetical protein
MSETQEKKALEEVRVDPREAEWLRKMVTRDDIRYRLFFQNSNANRTFLQIGLIEDVLTDSGAVIDQDFHVEGSNYDMADAWNRSQAGEQYEKFGNSVYLTQRGMTIVRDIIKGASHEDFKHTFDKVTVLQERTD